MTMFALITVAGYGLASAVTAARAFMQHPRIAWAPSVPNLKGAIYDILALVLGLRAWVLWQERSCSSLSEMFVALAILGVAAVGAGKVVFYGLSRQLAIGLGPRFEEGS